MGIKKKKILKFLAKENGRIFEMHIPLMLSDNYREIDIIKILKQKNAICSEYQIKDWKK